MHVNGPDQAEWLRRALAPHARGDHPSTPDCLDEDTLTALAEGTLDAETHTAVTPHVASCPRCRHLVASVARAIADPDVAKEIRALVGDAAEGSRRRRVQRTGWIAAGVAAASVLLLLAWPPPLDEPLPHRALPMTAAPAPEAVSPVGTVAEARSLRWTAAPGADRYRVTLFDAAGTILYETELADTVAVLPDSVLPVPGVTYWWEVEARVGFDRWAASGLIEFSVAGGPGR